MSAGSLIGARNVPRRSFFRLQPGHHIHFSGGAGMAEAESIVSAAIGSLVEEQSGIIPSQDAHAITSSRRLLTADDGADGGSSSSRGTNSGGGSGASGESADSVPPSSGRPAAGDRGGGGTRSSRSWLLCPLSNISVCAPTVESTRAGAGFSVAVWNPLARSRTHHLRIPVAAAGAALWSVRGATVPFALCLVPRVL